MTNSSSALSVGLIVKSTKIWRWQSQLIEALVRDGLINVSKVFVSNEEDLILPRAVAHFYQLDALIFRSPMAAFELVELDFPITDCVDIFSANADSETLPFIDLLINFSEKPVAGELMKTTKAAILETHFSQGSGFDALNSGYFGFSAFSQGEKQCYFSIVAYRADEVVHVLAESHPSLDAGPLSRSMNQHWKLLEVSWLRVCRALQSKELERCVLRKIDKGLPDAGETKSYKIQPLHAYKNLATTFLDKFSQKFLRKEQWRLLIKFQSSDAQQLPLSFADYCEISPPDNCFWADPFVISEGHRHYVFFEELPFATERGHLSCMEVFSDGSHTEPKIILKKPYHLSYPNVFSYESEYYMIPESGDAGFIDVYHCTEFPYYWEHQCTVMEGLYAYDSTLVEHDGIWWLFACVAADKGMSGNEELHIFYAETPLSQEWEPHALNPVISDASLARPAGNFFEWEGALYRPSQDCAGNYGAGVNINLIKTLDKQRYVEERVHCARPNWDTKLTALHTLNFNQQVSVADVMRVGSRFF